MSQIQQPGATTNQEQINERIAVILHKNNGDIDVSLREWMALAAQLNIPQAVAGRSLFELYGAKYRPLTVDEIRHHVGKLSAGQPPARQQSPVNAPIASRQAAPKTAIQNQTQIQVPQQPLSQQPLSQQPLAASANSSAPIAQSPQGIPTRATTPVNPRTISTTEEYHDLGFRVAQVWCQVMNKRDAVWYLGDFQLSPRKVTLKFDFSLELCSAEQLSKYRKTLMSKAGLPSEASIDAHPGFIGITLPRQNWQPYLLAQHIEDSGMRSPTDWPTLTLGVDDNEQLVCPSLRNLLIAGSPDSGKSQGLKLITADLMLKYHPNHLRMLLIDLKGESAPELGFFSGLPWLMTYFSTDGHKSKEVIRTWEQAKLTLEALESIEKSRWKKLSEAGCSRIDQYNRRNPQTPIPYLVTVIDEFSLLTEGDQEGATLLANRTKTGRASGMLYVLATQRPSGSAVDQVVTPALSQNFTERLVLRCSTDADYKIALGRKTGSIPTLGEKGHAILSTDGREQEIQLLYAPEDWIKATIFQRGAQFASR